MKAIKQRVARLTGIKFLEYLSKHDGWLPDDDFPCPGWDVLNELAEKKYIRLECSDVGRLMCVNITPLGRAARRWGKAVLVQG